MSISKHVDGTTDLQSSQSSSKQPIPARPSNQLKGTSSLKDKVQLKPLTRKQEAFVQELISNPKQSATKAVLKTYNVNNARTASVVATENLAKPSIVSRLAEHSDAVENMMVNAVKDWGRSDNTRQREIALDTGKFIHDKVHGKATQRIEQSTSVVRININMNKKPEPES